MAKVAIVTDSTANIPLDIISQYQISVAPQELIWGEENFQDGVNIQPSEFYERLKTAKVMPSTSQVTPASFLKIFGGLAEEGYDILAILISNELSGTIASALQAREMLKNPSIEIVDSRTTAMALGFQALMAARAAKQGASLAEVKALANNAVDKVGVVFAVDTLEFLHRGGRIGGGKRFLATALNIKPILEVTGGKVEGIEQVRTRSKSLNRIVELINERTTGRKPVRLATLHANAPEEAKTVLAEASKVLNPIESIFAEVSPVIGTHAGPGTVGLAFMAGM